ncbi:hypothetical protein [Kozakia baliensis]|uniref:hypothetical protein n=1 Tax=Kozakia baliensis TaxID=153496 RepID=UPI00116F0CDB|nr:hypothetical protein [Kozakia baliensis]GBR32501.1 hypothetical protein AA0488_2563 [Kozakia baliensis NRIC 0488]GEL64468.1 hypothetical protein KBA01_17540 [Kozakia baliensis]
MEVPMNGICLSETGVPPQPPEVDPDLPPTPDPNGPFEPIPDEDDPLNPGRREPLQLRH